MKTLRAVFIVAVFVILTSFMQSCTIVTVEPGEVAVLTDQPWFFGHGGVRPQTVSTGRSYTWISTDYEKYTVTPIMYEEHFENIMTSDNNPVSFSAYIKISVKGDSAAYLHKTFLAEWYKNNVQPKFRTKVRDKACMYEMFKLTTDRTVSTKMESELVAEMTQYVNKIKIPVIVEEVNIGSVQPQPDVLAEIAQTAVKVQNQKTQDAEKAAQIKRQGAETERAIADQAYKNNMGLTNDQFIQLKTIEMYEKAAKEGTTFLFGSVPGVTVGK